MNGNILLILLTFCLELECKQVCKQVCKQQNTFLFKQILYLP